MFKSLKIGTKLTGAFCIVAALALLLGGLAVFGMWKAGRIAGFLDQARIPEVVLANEVERAAQNTRLEAGRFMYTEDSAAATAALQDLAQARTALEAAARHATRYNRTQLQQNASAALEKVAQWASLLIALGLIITRAITSPVEQLVAGLARIAAGDLSARVAVESSDEIGQLSAAAHTMAGALDAKARLALAIGHGDLRQNVVLASAEEMTTSASSLTEHAESLQAAIGFFKADATGAATAVADAPHLFRPTTRMRGKTSSPSV